MRMPAEDPLCQQVWRWRSETGWCQELCLLRCCSGEKIRRISVIATVIPALPHTFYSKKIHYDMFQPSSTADDISLGSSVHFGLHKDRMAQERRADLHSGKRIVIYHESEQKWIFSLSLLLQFLSLPPSHLTCSPLEHHEEDNKELVKDPHGHSWDVNSLPVISRDHKTERH